MHFLKLKIQNIKFYILRFKKLSMFEFYDRNNTLRYFNDIKIQMIQFNTDHFKTRWTKY